MVAEARDLDPRLLAGLDQREPGIDLDRVPVNDDRTKLGHGGAP